MLRPLLRALFKTVRRDLSGYGSLKTNNFFIFVAMMVWGAAVSGVMPVAAYPFLIALAALMILPASGDPLDKIPGVRLGLWPMTRSTRIVLRALSLVLNPAFWVVALLIALRSGPRIALGFISLITLARLVGNPRLGRPQKAIVGPTQLVTNNLRQMFSVLDTWLALAVGLGGGLWRLVAKHTDNAAFPVLGVLAAIALSTYAQCLFALDDDSGITRYRLLPIAGWHIVLSKDVAFLAVLLLALLPMSPLSLPRGLAFGLTTLTIGRYPAMRLRLPQERWRFTSGRVLWSVLQGIAGVALPSFIAPPLYVISLWWAGRAWDRRNRRT
jgi:hypothetical protein